MYHLKRINYLILILLSIFFTCKVNALVNPTDKFYVNDYADILSPETEKYIYEKSVKLNKADGTQIVVVTVKNLEGKSIEDYSLELVRNFKIGNGEKDNGILLLLALEERDFRVEVGNGLEGILPDGKTGRIQDQYMIPYLSEDNFDEGIKNGYDAFYNEIVKMNNLDLETTTPIPQEESVYSDSIIFAAGLGFVIGMLLGKVEKGFKISGLYLIIAAFLFAYFKAQNPIYLLYLVPNIMAFIISRLIYGISKGTGIYSTSSYGGSYSSRSSRSSSSRSRSSTSHRGGGGSFSGGGSTRHF